MSSAGTTCGVRRICGLKKAQILPVRLLLLAGPGIWGDSVAEISLRILIEQRTRKPSMYTGWRCVRIQPVDTRVWCSAAARACVVRPLDYVSAGRVACLELIRRTRQFLPSSFVVIPGLIWSDGTRVRFHKPTAIYIILATVRLGMQRVLGRHLTKGGLLGDPPCPLLA